MTLEDLAEASGTSVAHLSRLESGERQPSLDGLLRLAFGLGVPFDELFEEPEEPGPGTVCAGRRLRSTKARASVCSPLYRRLAPRGSLL
jgi:transcriptional regulator with XRE-family HTH domain